MTPRCAAPACPGTTTTNRALCETCADRRALNIAVALGMVLPPPVMPDEAMLARLMTRVNEE